MIKYFIVLTQFLVFKIFQQGKYVWVYILLLCALSCYKYNYELLVVFFTEHLVIFFSFKLHVTKKQKLEKNKIGDIMN